MTPTYPLLQAIGFERGVRYRKAKAPGFMDLVVEKIAPKTYSLAHYYVQNGDMMRDPEITFRLNDDDTVDYRDLADFADACNLWNVSRIVRGIDLGMPIWIP